MGGKTIYQSILWGNIWWVGPSWEDLILVSCRPKYLGWGGWSKNNSGTKMQMYTKQHFWGKWGGWVLKAGTFLVSEK